MDKIITSHNQQGGITAGTVNTNSINQENSIKTPTQKKWYNNPWIRGIVVGVIVGVILFYIFKIL